MDKQKRVAGVSPVVKRLEGRNVQVYGTLAAVEEALATGAWRLDTNSAQVLARYRAGGAPPTARVGPLRGILPPLPDGPEPIAGWSVG